MRYDRDELNELPEEWTAHFAGIANPHRNRTGKILPGKTVLDHACGAGMDLFLATMRVGKTGLAIGVDMTKAMRDCAQAASKITGLSETVDIREDYSEDLPVEDGSVDVVISHGVEIFPL